MARKSRKNVGLIGLGIIGSRVAAGLRSAGFHVYVWNRTPRAAPNFVGSPGEVAELCDIIQLFVADAHALFEVLDALGPKLTPAHVILCNATVGPEATLEAAKLVEERGAKFLDAPFTGSKAAAEARQLVYFVSGEEAVFRRAEPALKASSKAIVTVGKIGNAATLKVVTNMLAAVTVQTLAEALAIVRHAGLAPELLAEVLEHHGARSSLIDQKLGQMLHADYEPHFSMKHMFKDVQLGIHLANALDVDVPATTATAGVMYGALSRGWAELDYAALAKVHDRADGQEKPAAATALPAGAEKTAAEPAAAIAPADAAPPKETLRDLAAPAPAPLPPRPPIEASVIFTEEKSDKPAEKPAPADGAAPQSPAAQPAGIAPQAAAAPQPAAASQPVIIPPPSAAAAPAGADTKSASADHKPAGPEKSSEPKPDAPPLSRFRRWFGTGGG